MSMSDPIADMLTRIRNAHMAELEVTEMPYSKIKSEITRVLKKEGFITDFVVEGGTKKILRIYLKYAAENEAAIRGLKRISKPGIRNYVKSDSIPKVVGGVGISVLSTSQGIRSDKEARKNNVGGEVLCSIW